MYPPFPSMPMSGVLSGSPLSSLQHPADSVRPFACHPCVMYPLHSSFHSTYSPMAASPSQTGLRGAGSDYSLCYQGMARGPRTPRPCFLGLHLNFRSLSRQRNRAWAGSGTEGPGSGVWEARQLREQPPPHGPGLGWAG